MNIKQKLKPFIGYLTFFSFALLLFFVSAFTVVLIRTRNSDTMKMPDIVGKNYTDIHNELTRLRLKVNLEKVRFPDKNDGEILTQSITAGKTIEAGSKLYVTINDGVDRIIIPDFKGQQLNNVRPLLHKILSGETYVSLTLGGITYIPIKNDQTPGTVIDQIPEPGKSTTTQEKIYLLVTEETTETKNSNQSSFFDGQPYHLVSKYLQSKKIKHKISTIVNTAYKNQNGMIESHEVKTDSSISLNVYYFNTKKKIESGYEKIEYKISEERTLKVVVTNPDITELKIDILQDEIKYESGENLNLVFYRTGTALVSILAEDGKKVESFKFKSDL